MKKRLIALCLSLTLCATALPAYAIAGSEDDPLISLSFLNTYKEQLLDELSALLSPDDRSGKVVSEQLLLDQNRYKQEDLLIADTGAELIVLAGEVQVDPVNGVVIDATNGTETKRNAVLSTNSRYIVGEDTTAVFTVLSPTAIVSCNGAVTISESDTPDYNAMADALKTLTLFKGTGSGIGEGYDLEKQPTRTEAIIMFIRLLGEEEAALSCTAEHPFTDVLSWAEPYVAYAYEKGYTNGVGNQKFGSSRNITSKEYVEFVMRALEYSSTEHTNLNDTLDNAVAVNLLTDAEHTLLSTSTLLRSHVVYVSYYALSMPIAQSKDTLEEKLLDNNVFNRAALKAAHALVETDRML